jgi:hypothetical protein
MMREQKSVCIYTFKSGEDTHSEIGTEMLTHNITNLGTNKCKHFISISIFFSGEKITKMFYSKTKTGRFDLIRNEWDSWVIGE